MVSLSFTNLSVAKVEEIRLRKNQQQHLKRSVLHGVDAYITEAYSNQNLNVPQVRGC